MATITIPFPSTETLLGPELAKAASPPKINIKPSTKKQPAFKKHSTQSKSLNGVAKPKQTKSRNGTHHAPPYRVDFMDIFPPTNVSCRVSHVQGKASKVRRNEAEMRSVQEKKRGVWRLQ